MIDRTWRIAFGVGIAAGVCAIALALIGGTHLRWTSGVGGTSIDMRIGAAGDWPSAFLGTVSVICLLLGSAFLALSKQPADSGSDGTERRPSSFLDFLRTLHRSSNDFWLAGVCGGLGEHSPVPTWVWRMLFLILIFCFGTGVLAYLILAICIPKRKFPPLPPRRDDGQAASESVVRGAEGAAP